MTSKLGWKTCTQCRRELLATKFYCHPGEPDGLMAHCKACHNGCYELAERSRVAALERQWGDPTEEQIVARAALIRSGWDEKTKARRVAANWLSKQLAKRQSA